jgi:GntR family transcriptional regulator/MocR family aminotransferase
MLRPWNLKLELEKGVNRALYLQIAEKIIDEIQTGRLPPATAMPGTRELAKTLSVNRKTTVLAYEELISQGWLATEKRRGTFVAAELPAIPHYNGVAISAETENASMSRDVLMDAEIEHLKQVAWVDFSGSTADNRLTPLEAFARAFRKALLVATRSNHQVNNPQGYEALRSAIASMVNMEKNFRIDADRVCVLSSSQMAIFILARALVRPDDCVVFERFSNPMSWQAFESCGAKLKYVDIDRHGLDVEQIASLALEQKIRAVYVTPQHQFPTTVMMTQERRQALYRLAELHDFYIIEDDREHESYFDEALPFPIASLDNSERTIYLGSLSNVLSPALQISYLIGRHELIEQCNTEKKLIDCQNKQIFEYAVSELMASGEIQRHRRRLSREFAERRQLMQELLWQELGQQVDFDPPRSGLAYWLRFRQPVDMQALAQHALTEKVKFSQGSDYSPDKSDVQAVRLGFANLNQSELRSGLKRFKRALMTSLLTMMFVVYEPLMS